MPPLKVCFISLRSYPLFAKNTSDYFGGAEVQMSLIARELAKDKKFAVSLITGDYSQPPVISRNRLKIYKTKLWDFFKILKLVNADIYIERTVNPKIILVYLFCRWFRKKFIYMVAHDWDINHPVIKLADLIITQHQQQGAALKFNSSVIPSLIKFKPVKKALKRKYILWVGRAEAWKKPLDFLELVRRYPKEKFIMICRPGKVKIPTDSLPNLQFFSSVPPENMLDFFRQAKILVNTSMAEGFPNTFLQAGAAKTPVLSFTVNPDHYLDKYHCGFVGHNLKRLFTAPRKLKIMGKNHYDYVKKYHSLKKLELVKQILYKL